MNRENLLHFCKRMIKTKSLSGKESEVASLITAEMRTLGYDEVLVDDFGNVIGKLNGSGNGSLLFEGHMDVVDIPSPEAWSVDPFGACIKNGRLYGRGAADMKSALGAMIHGVAAVRREIKADIYVTAVICEEILEGVGFGKVLDRIRPDAVILGEPNNLSISIGQKGRAEIVLETSGVNAHSASPEVGVNAIEAMLPLLNKVISLPVIQSKTLGDGILVATDIISSPYPGSSVIPDRCRVTLDRRLIEDESRQNVLAPIQNIIRQLSKEKSDFKADVTFAAAELQTYTGETLKSERYYPGWILNEESGLVTKAKQAFRDIGMEPGVDYYRFCTDGSESAGKRHIPTLGIGPAKATMAHVVDEYVEIEDIVSAAEIYGRLAILF